MKLLQGSVAAALIFNDSIIFDVEQVENLLQEREKIEAENTFHSSQRQELLKEMEALAESVKALKSEKSEAEEIRRMAVNEKKEADKRIQELCESIALQKEKHDVIQMKMESLKRNLQERSSALREKVEQSALQRSEAAEAKKQIERLTVEHQRLESKVINLKEALKELRTTSRRKAADFESSLEAMEHMHSLEIKALQENLCIAEKEEEECRKRIIHISVAREKCLAEVTNLLTICIKYESETVTLSLNTLPLIFRKFLSELFEKQRVPPWIFETFFHSFSKKK